MTRLTSPRPNHPLQLAFLDRVLPPHPRAPTALAQLHKGLCPPPAHPTPKSARNGDSPWGGQRDFFFFLPRIDFILPPPSPTVGRGRHKNPSTPPKREKTLTSNRALRSRGASRRPGPGTKAGGELVCAELQPRQTGL